MAIKAVFWDLNDTLELSTLNSIARAKEFATMLSRRDYNFNSKQIEKELFWNLKNIGYDLESCMEKTIAGLFHGMPENERKIARRLLKAKTAANAVQIQKIPRLLEMLQKINELNVMQVIVTDNLKANVEKSLESLGIAHLIAHVSASDDDGFLKPDKRRYLNALEHASRLRGDAISPAEVLVIGDSISRDIKGAGNSGMHSALALYSRILIDQDLNILPDNWKENELKPENVLNSIEDAITLIGKL